MKYNGHFFSSDSHLEPPYSDDDTCDKCCEDGELVEYDGLMLCEYCLPLCTYFEHGEKCGEVADPDGEGCCEKHEKLLNSMWLN